MADVILSYQQGSRRGPSRWATWAVRLACAGVILLSIGLINFHLFVRPLYVASSAHYYRYKIYLTVIPAWTAMGMTLVGGSFAIVGLLQGRASRRRAVLALAFCVIFLIILAATP